MSDTISSVSARAKVDIQVRRYAGIEECDVVIASRGRELVLTCPDYASAVRWAEMECKSYKLTPNFVATHKLSAS